MGKHIGGELKRIEAALQARGSTLFVKGRANTELPPPVRDCFKYSIIELADDRRAGPTVPAASLMPRGTLGRDRP